MVVLTLCATQSIECVAIDGGAAELTWSLRTFEGASVKCTEANVDKIRLCWNALDDGVLGCRPGQFRDFDCEDQTGVTLFEIPTGRTRLYVEPICDDQGAAAVSTYQTPPDIVRTVREGEVVTLNSLLIEVTEQENCGERDLEENIIECTCVRP